MWIKKRTYLKRKEFGMQCEQCYCFVILHANWRSQQFEQEWSADCPGHEPRSSRRSFSGNDHPTSSTGPQHCFVGSFPLKYSSLDYVVTPPFGRKPTWQHGRDRQCPYPAVDWALRGSSKWLLIEDIQLMTRTAYVVGPSRPVLSCCVYWVNTETVGGYTGWRPGGGIHHDPHVGVSVGTTIQLPQQVPSTVL